MTDHIHLIIKNTITALADTDAELCDLKNKYKKLLEFVNNVKNSKCLGCQASDLLKEIGEFS